MTRLCLSEMSGIFLFTIPSRPAVKSPVRWYWGLFLQELKDKHKNDFSLFFCVKVSNAQSFTSTSA
jgi:hypothetical protein